jgi:ketosteroid isomerase-like protein
MRLRNLVRLALLCCSATGAKAQEQSRGPLAEQVFDAESAFARTLAARDSQAFATYVASDAVFLGREGALHGRAAIVAGWYRFFEGRAAPFSWSPDIVEVLASGTLALSSGPVRDPAGRRIGTFNSIWRRDTDGHWRVVFDKGCSLCDCAPGR